LILVCNPDASKSTFRFARIVRKLKRRLRLRAATKTSPGLEGRAQRGDIVPRLLKHFLPIAIAGGGNSANKCRADDQSVGHRREQADMLGATDAKADADRQLRLAA